MTQAGPLVQIDISLSRTLLRVAPVWSVLAGAVAVAGKMDDPALWLRVVTAVVIGDLIWGILRRYIPLDSTVTSRNGSFTPLLPYSQPDAPLSRLLEALAPDGGNWHGAFAGMILALAGALLLGLPALALSLAAIVVSVVAWPLARRGDTPVLCLALLDVLLPFLLGMVAAGWLDARPISWQPMLVAASFTLLQWGFLAAAPLREGVKTRRLTFGLAVVVLLVVLIALRMPWATAVVAALLAPPLYLLTGGWGASAPRVAVGTLAGPRAGPWLMLALFVVAAALR